MKLKIGKKEFDIKVADNDEKRAQGLRGMRSMPSSAGLVLKYDTPTRIPITMSGMNFPIGIVHMFDGQVQSINIGEPDQDNEINTDQYSDSVLEVNVEDVNEIKKGDKVEWIGSKKEGGMISYVSEEVKPEDGSLHVLDDKGKVQANVKGNERVFSRKDTQNIYSKASRASETGDDNHYASLGRAFVRMLNRQDSNEPEYVEE